MDLKEIIKLWKKLGIKNVEFEYNAGGDCMGDTQVILYDKDDKVVESPELDAYFEDEVYNCVEFYVNSDGYYIGEAGTVDITLNDEGDGFNYCKNAQYEYSESTVNDCKIKLSDEAVAFIKDKVSNINGGEFDGFIINYERDLLLSDEEEKLLAEIEKTIKEATFNFVPDEEIGDGEWDEWYTYTTNDDEEDIIFDGNELVMHVTNQYTEYRNE